jgi:two-component system cell cycle sensor histidine kinase/response regulator CckA
MLVETRPKSQCILIAEDDALIRRNSVMTLAKLGYRVLKSCDGMEAVNVVQQHPETIDLLITNVHMPRIEGHELARIVKTSRPPIKVLIISGDGERNFPPEAKYHDYALLKPVTSERLARTVVELLGGAVKLTDLFVGQESR